MLRGPFASLAPLCCGCGRGVWGWCIRQGSNLHARGRRLLRALCIPVPPRMRGMCTLVKCTCLPGTTGDRPVFTHSGHALPLMDLCAPCYREGASGYLLVIATRASDSKWSGSMARNNASH